jgi:hypothetical protein
MNQEERYYRRENLKLIKKQHLGNCYWKSILKRKNEIIFSFLSMYIEYIYISFFIKIAMISNVYYNNNNIRTF